MYLSMKQVEDFQRLRQQIESAAVLLFEAYTEALPDQQNWKGPYAWHGTCGTIEIGDEEIHYHKEHYFRGDTDNFYLSLPLSALYDPEFITKEVLKDQQIKEQKAKEKLEQEMRKIEDCNKRERELFESLKKKFEG